MKRPSHRELTNKIRDARIALEKEQVLLVNLAALAEDALHLGYLIDFELVDVLKELVHKSLPENYTGQRPPQRSYEQEINGLELFAFVVDSKRFNKPVYYKFALAQDTFGWSLCMKTGHKRRCHE